MNAYDGAASRDERGAAETASEAAAARPAADRGDRAGPADEGGGSTAPAAPGPAGPLTGGRTPAGPGRPPCSPFPAPVPARVHVPAVQRRFRVVPGRGHPGNRGDDGSSPRCARPPTSDPHRTLALRESSATPCRDAVGSAEQVDGHDSRGRNRVGSRGDWPEVRAPMAKGERTSRAKGPVCKGPAARALQCKEPGPGRREPVHFRGLDHVSLRQEARESDDLHQGPHDAPPCDGVAPAPPARGTGGGRCLPRSLPRPGFPGTGTRPVPDPGSRSRDALPPSTGTVPPLVAAPLPAYPSPRTRQQRGPAPIRGRPRPGRPPPPGKHRPLPGREQGAEP